MHTDFNLTKFNKKLLGAIYFFYYSVIIKSILINLIYIFTQPLRSGRIWHKVNF